MGGVIALFLVYVLVGLLPLLGILYVLYFLLTLPMRRNERGRMLVTLLELGLQDGRTAEAALLDAASSQDRALGVRFHLLATFLGKGMRLSQALGQVPRLLPPQLQAILVIGERTGDIRKVLPACHTFLEDGVSKVRSALNYLVMLSFVATPFAIFVLVLIRIKILPSFEMLSSTMLEGAPLPAFTRMVFAGDWLSVLIQALVLGLLWMLTLTYLGGPRLRRWLTLLLGEEPAWLDYLICLVPWRWKRLQRDFSTMLAVLLEAQIPEPEAVRLAAESTTNAAFVRRAARVRQRLGQGAKLTDALAMLDDSGELHWRLTNALNRGNGFLRALSGWHESLDARAFQLEQATAQIFTTLLVLVNGLVVGCIVIAVFLVLIQIIQQATLW